MNFLSELATNSSARGVSWVIYSGNDDSQDAHKGTESESTILLVNPYPHTQLSGSHNPGFSLDLLNLYDFAKYSLRIRPSAVKEASRACHLHHGMMKRETLWELYTKNASSPMFFSIVRAIRYHCTNRRPWAPANFLLDRLILTAFQAFHFLQEFVLGNSSLGRVEKVKGHTTVIGGENSSLATFIPGEHNPIFYGSGATQSSTIWPSATIAAWDSFMATATHTSESKKHHHHHPRAFATSRPWTSISKFIYTYSNRIV